MGLVRTATEMKGLVADRVVGEDNPDKRHMGDMEERQLVRMADTETELVLRIVELDSKLALVVDTVVRRPAPPLRTHRHGQMPAVGHRMGMGIGEQTRGCMVVG